MSRSSGPAADDGTPGLGGPKAPADGRGPALLAAIWVGLNMARAAWGVMAGWRLTFEPGIPEAVLALVQAELIAGIVNMLWGLALIGLAIGSPARFPRHFTIWQVVNIVWIIGQQAYVLVTPDFAPTNLPLLYAAAEIAIGAFCILMLRRRSGPAEAGPAEARPPSVAVVLIFALLGIVVGGALGFGGGLLGGALIAEVTDMSCFEGACGYLAFFIGLFAMLVGAIGGGIFAVWRVSRRRPPRPA